MNLRFNWQDEFWFKEFLCFKFYWLTKAVQYFRCTSLQFSHPNILFYTSTRLQGLLVYVLINSTLKIIIICITLLASLNIMRCILLVHTVGAQNPNWVYRTPSQYRMFINLVFEWFGFITTIWKPTISKGPLFPRLF